MRHLFSLLVITALIAAAAGDAVSKPRRQSAGPLSEEFKRAAAVFNGTVVSVTKPPPDEYRGGDGRVIYEDKAYVFVTFEVKRSWKGVAPGERVITIRVEGAGLSCGVKLRRGVVYSIYAVSAGGEENAGLWVDPCGRVGRIEEAGKDLRELKPVKSRRGAGKRGRRSLTTACTRRPFLKSLVQVEWVRG